LEQLCGIRSEGEKGGRRCRYARIKFLEVGERKEHDRA
jgi:hypothetical protein